MTDTPNTDQPMTVEAATARRAEMISDAGFTERYMAGGVPERDEMLKVSTALSIANSAESFATEQQIASLKSIADISDDVANEIRSGRAVTPQERQFALDLKAKLMRDRAWVAKYLDGDRECATKVALLSVVLSARVAEPQK